MDNSRFETVEYVNRSWKYRMAVCSTSDFFLSKYRPSLKCLWFGFETALLNTRMKEFCIFIAFLQPISSTFHNNFVSNDATHSCSLISESSSAETYSSFWAWSRRFFNLKFSIFSEQLNWSFSNSFDVISQNRLNIVLEIYPPPLITISKFGLYSQNLLKRNCLFPKVLFAGRCVIYIIFYQFLLCF